MNRVMNEYDYRTSPVNGSEIFDTTRQEIPNYESVIPGNEDAEYFKEEKNKIGKIVQMSPEEYYNICAKDIFNTSVDKLKEQRRYNKNTLDKLKDVITVEKKRFPLCAIDYTEKGQEGLHRMMVAGDLFGWDTKFPVLVIDWYDKDLHDREVKEKHINDLTKAIKDTVDRTLNDEPDSFELFKDYFEDNWRSDYYNYDFCKKPVTIEQVNNKITITVEDVTYTVEDDKDLDVYTSEFEDDIY